MSGNMRSVPYTILMHFYRTMQYSAKHGIAIACHLSVRLSVTLMDQDHIGWKSWKLTTRQLAQHLCSS